MGENWRQTEKTKEMDDIGKAYILKARIVGFKIPQKIELFTNFPHFFLLRTRKISHTDLFGLAWISHTAHRTQRVHIGKNISVIFSMINMEV